MRMLKIETFVYQSGELVDALSVPSTLAKTLIKLLPKNFASQFEENSEQLEALMSAISAPEFTGTILDITDKKENERVVISIS